MADFPEMHPAFAKTGHRPWPMPSGRWTWRQAWCDLLFAHWPVPAATLRPLVPPDLEIQQFDGTSWIGVVPFRMEGVMRRPFPDLPGFSAFPELNVRLYVEKDGKPGVWFLSLDAHQALAVWGGRTFYRLPYHRARMSLVPDGEGIQYRSERVSDGRDFRADYEPCEPVELAEPGTLEHWLTERYCLYARSRHGGLVRTEVHHLPWPLQRATARIECNNMLRPWLAELDGTAPAVLHFARRIEVVVWPGVRCG